MSTDPRQGGRPRTVTTENPLLPDPPGPGIHVPFANEGLEAAPKLRPNRKMRVPGVVVEFEDAGFCHAGRPAFAGYFCGGGSVPPLRGAWLFISSRSYIIMSRTSSSEHCEVTADSVGVSESVGFHTLQFCPLCKGSKLKMKTVSAARRSIKRTGYLTSPQFCWPNRGRWRRTCASIGPKEAFPIG